MTNQPKTYEAHPFADIFPRLKDIDRDGFNGLVEDIKARGQQEPIMTYEAKILDGRNRYDACLEAKVEPKCRDYLGTDPVGYVLSANLHRRHLNESQRAMVAAKLTTLELGANQHSAKEGVSIDTASKAVNVGRASVARAKVVLKSGDQGLIKEVEKGKTSVSSAASQAQQSKTTESTKGKGKGKAKPASTPSTNADDAYDKAEEELLDCLENLAADEAEAAGAATIRNIQKTVSAMLKAAEKASAKKIEEEHEAA
jgi:ParB-like chromosome segregation protein Spo0J